MDEAGVNLGVWLANDRVNLFQNRDTISALVIGVRTMREFSELLLPLAKKLKGGLSAYAAFIPNYSGSDAPPSSRIRINNQPAGTWDLVVFSPRYCEQIPARELKQAIIFALTKGRLSQDTRIVFAVPTTPESNPINLRIKIFGTAPATLGDEEVKGTCCEEDAFQALESLGFCEVVTQPLACQVDVSKYLKNVPGGIKEMSDWLRCSVATCRQASASEIAQVRKLCSSSSAAAEMEISQPKTVFIFPPPPGFEHDSRAQPSKQAWWPRDTFNHYGLTNWDEQRLQWNVPKPDQASRFTAVPKLSTSQMNAFVDSLVGQREKVDLPCRMRLTDLLDALLDVWESED